MNNVTFFNFSEVLIEETGVGSQESLLLVAYHVMSILLVSLSHG